MCVNGFVVALPQRDTNTHKQFAYVKRQNKLSAMNCTVFEQINGLHSSAPYIHHVDETETTIRATLEHKHLCVCMYACVYVELTLELVLPGVKPIHYTVRFFFLCL